jgi:manganese/zinc/iron transport system substrate-binding protein
MAMGNRGRNRGGWTQSTGALAAAGLMAALLLALAAVPGCGGGGAGSSKPRAVATTSMVGDLVRRIGGDHVDVKVIMGAGVDPHTYKPSPDDIAELARAKVIFYNGLHLEGKMVDLFEAKLKDKSVAVSSGVPAGRLLEWKQGEGGVHDPHVWFDVELWSLAAVPVRDKLIEVDPAHAGDYRRRTDELQKSLAALHREVTEKIASIPKERRVLVTSHDAYSYFGRAYGIDVRGLQGISTETEAGLREINDAVAFVAERKIPAIFVETSVNPKTIERVKDDVNRRGGKVEVPGELFSDAMGSPGQHKDYAVETYEGMVRYNVDTIVKALK